MSDGPSQQQQPMSGDPVQPWLHDLDVAVSAPTQLWCGRDGQVHEGGAQGVYHADVRVLSRVELQVGGRDVSPVQVAPHDAGEILTVAVARHLGDPGPDPTVRIDRRSRVTSGRLVEGIRLVSSAQRPVRTDVRLWLACDLAPMDAVKSGRYSPPAPPRELDAAVEWAGPGGLRARVHAQDASLLTREDHVEVAWEVELSPGGSAELSWGLDVHDPDAILLAAPESGPGQSWRPTVEADDHRLARWVDRSVRDLEALRMSAATLPGETFLAAGAPWYLTLFGRDSLWAARMLLPLGTEQAGSTLRLLASRQGRRDDANTEEQPGKILHEVRRDELTLDTDSARAVGGVRLPPVYYGTVDATPLWVCLLHDAWRWGLPDEEVEPLLPALEAALTWITEHGDSDGDGFLEYVDTTGRGLSNQGWKDSGDSVRWRDGSLAKAPIALCEPQGYAHEAAVGAAALLDWFGRPGADRWLSWAEQLRGRFRKSFWVEDRHGRFPAIALDADKRPVDSLTSNPGHLLGTGLLDTEEEAAVAGRMVTSQMSSGFGLRSLAAGSGGFSPLSYHCGSVWPHDTAIVMTGLARAGHHTAAAELLDGLLSAAEAFSWRLPELFGGDSRDDVPMPVPYPAACFPQAWSAAAAVAALGVAVGLRPDVPSGQVEWSPLTPSPLGALRVSGLRVAGSPVEAETGADGAPVRLSGCDLPVR